MNKVCVILVLFIIIVLPVSAFQKDGLINIIDLDLFYAAYAFDELFVGSQLGYSLILPQGSSFRGVFNGSWTPGTPVFGEIGVGFALDRKDELRRYTAIIDWIQGDDYDVITYETGKTMTASIHSLDFGARFYMVQYDIDSWNTNPEQASFNDIQALFGYRYTLVYDSIGPNVHMVDFFVHGIAGLAHGRENSLTSTANGEIVPGIEAGIRWMPLYFTVMLYDAQWTTYLTLGGRIAF